MLKSGHKMRPPPYLLLLLVLILDLVYGKGNGGGGGSKGGKNAEKCVSGHCLKPG